MCSQLALRGGRLLSTLLLAAAATASPQQGQIAFSLDWQGPSQGQIGSGGTNIEVRESDLLTPLGGFPTFDAPFPVPLLTGQDLGLPLYGQIDPEPGVFCGVEVDAFSGGSDLRPAPGQLFQLFFSADEYATGLNIGQVNVLRDEAPAGDVSADIFTSYTLPNLPVPPFQTPPPAYNAGSLDGNGLASANGDFYRGLGVKEPNDAGAGLPNAPFDTGDNVDAFDLDLLPGPGPVFFSLDSNIFDPLVGLPNTGSAQANFGGSGADVFVTILPGGSPQLYATAAQLGLNPALDDVDALIIAENGFPGFQPSSQLYDWFGPQPRDMLLFSVRRGSAIIGTIDSLQGLAIQPGDILTVPLPTAPDPGQAPAIVIAAEALGLETERSGATTGGELDGADIRERLTDCQPNNVDDSIDVATGDSADDNDNGIPDECESPGASTCDCPVGDGPCGNDQLNEDTGCVNSTGQGVTLKGTGTSSLFTDELVLTASGLPLGQNGIVYMGTNQINQPFGDGRRCAGGSVFRYPIQNSGQSGSFSLGPGIGATTCVDFGQAGCILSGSTWIFQAWYRDPGGSCGSGFNLSNAWGVTFSE